MSDPRPQPAHPSAVWTPPGTFEEYQLLRALGSGGMGRVYLARDTHLERLVAIKFMNRHFDVTARERFLREARAAARLDHPNVVGVYRIGEVAGRPFIVSEYVRGKSLAAIAKPVPWQEALAMGRDLARGLAAAHERGILHRDIKPGNAICSDAGEIKLLDFGLAKLGVAASVSAPGHEPMGGGLGTAVRPDDGEADSAQRSPELVGASEPLSASDALSETDDTATMLVGDNRTLDTLSVVDVPAAREFGDERSLDLAAVPDLTHASMRIGTPLYMPPETWRGQPATMRSDVYSLGVVLYELCTGRRPHELHERAVRDIGLERAICERDPRPVQELAPDVMASLAAVIERCLHRDPARRYASGSDLWEALEAVGERGHIALPTGNPYRGLQPFDAAHRGLFFGRAGDIRAVIDRLRVEPLVLVTGESGVGKSSLCRAGIAPLVADGALVASGGAAADDDGERVGWEVVTVLPGRSPVRALLGAVQSVLGADAATGADDPEAVQRAVAEPHTLARRLLARARAGRGILLLADQLEELVTLSEPAQAAAFAEILAELAVGEPGLRVLATVRGDYWTRLAGLPGLGDHLARSLYLLRPLRREGLREVIVGPARATGLRFEPETLVDEIVDEMVDTGAAGGLPLLQFALAALWDRRQGGAITRAALDRLVGMPDAPDDHPDMPGVLDGHPDNVIDAMTTGQRAAAREILLRLVTPEQTPARKTRHELITGDDGDAALEALVRGRLVLARASSGQESGPDDDEACYELVHEELITHWGILRGWLNSTVETRAMAQRVGAAAAEWERLGRADEALWSAGQLAEAARLSASDLPARDAGFIAASRRAVVRQRWRRRGATVVVLALVVAIYAGVRHKQQGQLDREVNDRLALARDALAEARARDSEVAARRAQALTRFDRHDRDGGEAAWRDALVLAASAERSYSRAGHALEAALALDPDRRAIRRELAEVLFARALLAARKHRAMVRDDLLGRLAVYDDGSMRARWDAPARVELATAPAGARIELFRYERRASGQRVAVPVPPPGATPGQAHGDWGVTPRALPELSPGSYLLVLRLAGRAPVRYPFVVARGENLDLALAMVAQSAVPDGFVHIPAGRFLFGSAAEGGEREFFDTAPLHRRSTDGFLIARHEVTFAEWIAFVEALPDAERQRRLPRTGSEQRDRLALTRAGDVWTLEIAPTDHVYRARVGQPIVYQGRTARARQDWLRFPVTGITWGDGVAYAAWLDATGRVPGARMCREDEWERAARGADDRLFPSGDRLAADGANIDLTYGRVGSAFGPDEVGSYPDSRSPFGIEDAAGNVMEMVQSILAEDEMVIRGGAYSYAATMAQTPNRTHIIDTGYRSIHAGLRICADLPSVQSGQTP